jgi:hypothetical protein
MSGFKQGSANSPFEDDEVDNDQTDSSTQTAEASSGDTTSTTKDASPSPSRDTRSDPSNVPYIARRRANGESTQWQRSRLTFYVRDHVETGERELKNEVETALEEEVTKFDLREAAYLVAQENPDAVAEKLEEMGVGFKL